ncbi:hypothetical protein ACSBR1_035984 [Camellia fascicularis]
MWSKALQSAIFFFETADGGYDGGEALEITVLLKSYCYDDDPLFVACGISIEKQPTQVDGRVLKAPKLKVGNGEDCIPRNGRWNCNNKQLFTPIRIEWWEVVYFSTRCDTIIQVIFPENLLTVEGTRALHQAQDKWVCVCFMIQASLFLCCCGIDKFLVMHWTCLWQGLREGFWDFGLVLFVLSSFQLTCDFLHIIVLMVLVPLPDIIYGICCVFIKALQEDPSALKILTQRYALDDVGSQSHVHLSLWENGKNIFMASGEHSKHGMSKVGEEFMAGVLNHLPSILAFTAPLPNRFVKKFLQ